MGFVLSTVLRGVTLVKQLAEHSTYAKLMDYFLSSVLLRDSYSSTCLFDNSVQYTK